MNTILPGFVLSALEATPKVTEKFFFWSGRGKLESIVRSWQTRLRKLFKLANVPNGHAHRFRDTFAVELLLAGVPIERVSILLGHQSVRITEKHYARGCARDRNNWKRIWLTPGVAIRSFFCKVGYTRGTRKGAVQQLVHLQ